MSNAIQKQQPDPLATIGQVLKTYQPSFQKLLPSHLTAERMFRVAMACIRQTPKLQECTPHSLVSSLMVASELGLEPGSARGLLYLVPFRNGKKGGIMEATPIVGYRGLIQLARNSGDLIYAEAHAVREKDKFDLVYGLAPKLEHRPAMADPGKTIATYSVATLNGGEKLVDMMLFAEIEKVRAMSRGKDMDPWVEHWDEMAKKTVVRRLMKYLPLSSERLQRAMELDGETVEGVVLPEIPAEPGPSETAQKALAATQTVGEIDAAEAAEIMAAEARGVK